MMCGPPKPSHPAKTVSESNAFTRPKVAKPSPANLKRIQCLRRPEVATPSTANALIFYVSRSRFLMIRRPKNLTPRPHLIVPEHGCAFELQNHREYGVTSCRAKGVCEKNLMVRNNLSL